MNILFFGSSSFGLPCLQALAESGLTVRGIVTQPDRPKGRKLSTHSTAIGDYAQEKGVRIFKPANINAPEAIAALRSAQADAYVVIAYGQILSQEVLDIPPRGCLNVHASLLPKYRGAAPINWAIIRAETQTGITIMRMVRKMDAGAILGRERLDIGADETASQLERRLSVAAVPLLLRVLRDMGESREQAVPQQDQEASYAPKLHKDDGLIDWTMSAAQIYNHLRGVSDWPGAFTYFRGTMLKISDARPQGGREEADRSAPGTVVCAGREGILVQTGSGSLLIRQLQPSGKRRMGAEEFLCGHRIVPGTRLGKK